VITKYYFYNNQTIIKIPTYYSHKKSNHNFRQRISQFPVTVGQSQIFYGDISAGERFESRPSEIRKSSSGSQQHREHGDGGTGTRVTK